MPFARGGSPSRSKDIKNERPGTAVSGEQPVARPPSMLPTLSVRVGRIEAMVNAIINRVDGVEGKALSDWRISESVTLVKADKTTPRPPVLL